MAARSSEMRVIFPKLPEFGWREEQALSEYLASKTAVLGVRPCRRAAECCETWGDLAFLSVEEPAA